MGDFSLKSNEKYLIDQAISGARANCVRNTEQMSLATDTESLASDHDGHSKTI